MQFRRISWKVFPHIILVFCFCFLLRKIVFRVPGISTFLANFWFFGTDETFLNNCGKDVRFRQPCATF